MFYFDLQLLHIRRRRKSDQSTPQVLDHLPMTCFDEVAENAYSTIKNNVPKKGINNGGFIVVVLHAF